MKNIKVVIQLQINQNLHNNIVDEQQEGMYANKSKARLFGLFFRFSCFTFLLYRDRRFQSSNFKDQIIGRVSRFYFIEIEDPKAQTSNIKSSEGFHVSTL